MPRVGVFAPRSPISAGALPVVEAAVGFDACHPQGQGPTDRSAILIDSVSILALRLTPALRSTNCLSYVGPGSHPTTLAGSAVPAGGRITRITTLTNRTHARNSSWNHLCSPAAKSRVSATR